MQNTEIQSLEIGIVSNTLIHTAQSGLKSDTHMHIRYAVCCMGLPIVRLIEINLGPRLYGPHLA